MKWQADHVHSNFSPVPMRVMDGSEPGDDTPAAVLSGAPIELQARTVRYGKTRPQTYTFPSTANHGYAASTNPPRPPLNPETGTHTTGVWTGTLCLKATAGRTL